MPRPPLSLAVVGADYPNKRGPGRRFEIELCKPGETVELRPEPKNPADPRAIAVYSVRGVQIGYLTAERAPLICRAVAEGLVCAIFQTKNQFGAYIRATFDGSTPILPPVKSDKSAQGQDFWPDPEWPDE